MKSRSRPSGREDGCRIREDRDRPEPTNMNWSPQGRTETETVLRISDLSYLAVLKKRGPLVKELNTQMVQESEKLKEALEGGQLQVIRYLTPTR